VDFACDRCRHSYYVPDELVHGRSVFRAKCTECDHAFEVKLGAAPPATRPVSPAASAPPRAAAAEHGETTGELAIAAYAREAAAHRRRNLLLAAGASLAALAAVAAIVVLRPERKAPEPTARRVAAEDDVAGSGPAPYADASGLMRKPGMPGAPAAGAGPVRTAPAERRKGPRIGRDDRKLLDLLAKKDDVAVLAPDGDSVDSAQSALAPEAVERTVAANRKGFDACISRALRMNPNLRVARRATLVVTVQPNGGVAGAFIAEEEVDRTELGACLSATARRMVFPAFDGEPLDVSMPLSLSAVF